MKCDYELFELVFWNDADERKYLILPMIDLFNGFMTEVYCNDTCNICYHEKEQFHQCNRCSFRTCFTCFESLKKNEGSVVIVGLISSKI